MTDDRTIALSTVYIYALWGVVLVGLAATLIALGVDHMRGAAALGITTLVMTGAAAVASMRYYVMRVCSVVRALSGLQPERVGELHRLP